MAGGEVGRLKIRVLPDTSRFRQDLKKALERIERTARVEVGLVLERGATARLRQQIEGVRADVHVGLDDSEFVKGVEDAGREARYAFFEKEAHLSLEEGLKEIQRQVAAMLSKISWEEEEVLNIFRETFERIIQKVLTKIDLGELAKRSLGEVEE